MGIVRINHAASSHANKRLDSRERSSIMERTQPALHASHRRYQTEITEEDMSESESRAVERKQ